MTSHLCFIFSPFWGYILSQRWLFALSKSALPNKADDVLYRRSLLLFVQGLQQITYALPLNNTSLTVTEIKISGNVYLQQYNTADEGEIHKLRLAERCELLDE